jgi:hypothetical protein
MKSDDTPSRRVHVFSRVPAQNASAPRSAGRSPSPPSPAAIAERAHALWQQRGCRQGHAFEDWLEAERQLAAGDPPAGADRPREGHIEEKVGFSQDSVDARSVELHGTRHVP